jgi:Domain of unknown function (DUF1918)
MHAHVGDRLRIHGRTVGQVEHHGKIVEIHEQGAGDPMYLVRYDDGSEALVLPGPDAVVEHQAECQVS